MSKDKNYKEINMSNYFIIHGSFGSPFVNWFPYLRKEIENRELVCYTPDFPTGVGYQSYESWSNILEIYLKAGLINEDTVIYAHSIAPAFVCKFLINHNVKVKRLIFVCGFNNYFGINKDYDAVNESMYCDNISDVKNLVNEIICYYSKNDPYVKYDAEIEFADSVATKRIIIDDGGHLNSESGYAEFPELLEYL